jgi:hypothetical protein
MLYKLVCENLANMLLIHLICIHFRVYLSICGPIVIQRLLCYFELGF